jgi:endonuclease/exonuclease/phosphatase family metal-dependent hydrolase
MPSLAVLGWNLFHGRDKPPEGGLDVNRVLRDEFAQVIAREPWDVALLQEAPLHWLRPLCRVAGASGASVRTSRSFGAPLRRALAEWSPDLVKSNEGGSNQVLARNGWRIAEARRLTLALLPERRRMIWVRLERPDAGPLTVANLHATSDDRPAATGDVVRAARAACSWSAELPLVFGGDFNLRMSETPQAFERLRAELGLAGARSGRALDHLLVRGLEATEPPHPLPPERREVQGLDGRPIRLSDHDPVTATYALPSRPTTTEGD